MNDIKGLLAPDSAMAPQDNVAFSDFCMPTQNIPAEKGLPARNFHYASADVMPSHKTNVAAKKVNAAKIMGQVNRAR